MSGTDRSRKFDLPPAPAVILVRPQLGENIGMVARAMLNCGLTELRLVSPRDGWPSATAEAAASGALAVLEGAQLFSSTEAALADLHRVYA
ncbi:MAG TPA: TrmH family RNA methyltransferase, partial [Kiloniellaceae bacterium]